MLFTKLLRLRNNKLGFKNLNTKVRRRNLGKIRRIWLKFEIKEWDIRIVKKPVEWFKKPIIIIQPTRRRF